MPIKILYLSDGQAQISNGMSKISTGCNIEDDIVCVAVHTQ